MLKEHYEPTEEDAERIMSAGQKRISWERERNTKGLERLGVHGYLELRVMKQKRERPFAGVEEDGELAYDNCWDDITWYAITGKLNDHAVDLTWQQTVRQYFGDVEATRVRKYDGHFSGKVDGFELSEKDSQKLVEVYQQYAGDPEAVDIESKELAYRALMMQEPPMTEKARVERQRQQAEEYERHTEAQQKLSDATADIMKELLPEEKKAAKPEAGNGVE